MAEMNLKQMIDRLNAEFTGEGRKLVFWYDDKAAFAEDIETMELQNAKIYHLQPDNQFYTKYFLERVDKTTNYLIYAPFPKPDVKHNHLEDTLLYSKRFFADRASLLLADFGIEEKYKPVIEKHMKFFASKERTQRFYQLGIDTFNEETIPVGLMSAICKAHTCSFEEVVRSVLMEDDLADNKLLQEFAKYDLLDSFWKCCEQYFGYTDSKPTLERLLLTMFVTYTARYVQAELPKAWKNFISYKSGNSIAFLDSLMNNVLYQDQYDALSDHVAKELQVFSAFAAYRADDLLECDTFLAIDQLLIQWLVERLLAEDTGAKLGHLTIPEICDKRSKMHFGRNMGTTYQMIKSAHRLVQAAQYHCPEGFQAIIQQYLHTDYRMDQEYRRFYFCYDQLEDTSAFETLRDLVENIYTNEYLATLLPAWNAGIKEEDAFSALPLQRAFFQRNLRQRKERTVVIISDAMRYEVGQELFSRMQDDPKCTAKLSVQLSVLPSYTRLGMAALLPHRSLEMNDAFEVLADGVLCDTLASRQQVLQSYVADSVCIQFDAIKGLKVAELRDVLTKRQMIYVYHNQIDARGDKANTEDEVFQACEEAIGEIMDLIHRISVSGNTYHFLVTADHGFIYKRDKLTESDKIRSKGNEKAFINRRFIVAKTPVTEDGIDNMRMGQVLENEDDKFVSYPISSNVFQVAGGGANFVHGGSSPQEMLVPVLEVKMERGHMETRKTDIMLVTILHKITNLNLSLDFIQSEAVGDRVKPAKYRIYFLSADNEKISNENTYVADSREESAQKRIFHLSFTLKNKKYDKNQLYYLVVTDEDTGVERWRQPVVMDIGFIDDLGGGR